MSLETWGHKPLNLTLRRKIAEKPYIAWSRGPKAQKYESIKTRNHERTSGLLRSEESMSIVIAAAVKAAGKAASSHCGGGGGWAAVRLHVEPYNNNDNDNSNISWSSITR